MVGYLDVLKNITFSSINIFFVEVINYFCGMVDGCKAFSLISSRDHCQRASSLQIFDMRCAGLESVQNLSSGFVEWICVAGITTTSQPHKEYKRKYFLSLWSYPYTEYNLLEIPVKQPKRRWCRFPIWDTRRYWDSTLWNHSPQSVCLSLSFLIIWYLVFSDIVHDDSWPWYLMTDKTRFYFFKKRSSPNLGQMVQNWAQK